MSQDGGSLYKGNGKLRFFNGYILFISISLFYLMLIFQGLDVTDSGFHLTNQVRSFSRHITHITDNRVATWFLSDFFGGMWLKIINGPNLLWARLGGVLLYSLTALISYKILSSYFDRKKVFLVVFASALLITTVGVSRLIHYYSFPALLLNLELLIFSQLLIKPAKGTLFKLYSFLVGFMTIPIILARLSLIPIAFAPIIFLSYYLITKKDLRELQKSVLYVVSGIFVSFAVFALFYRSIGALHPYIKFMASIYRNAGIGSTHKMSWLLENYIYEYWSVFRIAAGVSIALYVIFILKERLGSIWLTCLVVCAICPIVIGFVILADGVMSAHTSMRAGFLKLMIRALLLMSFIYVREKNRNLSLLFLVILFVVMASPISWVAYWMFRSIIPMRAVLVKLVIGLVCTVSFIFFIYERGKNRNLSLLLLVSLFVMIISPIGSSSGILKSTYGMWLVLPLTFLMVYELRDRIHTRWLKSTFSLNTIAILLLVLVSLFIHFTYVYRDSHNRFELNTQFKYKPLRHIYSRKDRVELVDEALVQIDQLTDKNDEVLMINEIPMFYYLTQTKPFFPQSWLFLESLKKIRMMCENAIKNGRYPKLFVCSNTNTSNMAWPVDKVVERQESDRLVYLVNKYTKELGYEITWQNRAFIIYSPKSAVSD